MITLAHESERRGFARGRMIGGILDRLEWVADGILAAYCQLPSDRCGDPRIAEGVQLIERDPYSLQDLGERMADVDGSSLGSCHSTSSVEGE